MFKFVKRLKISVLFIIYLISNLLLLVIPAITILLYNGQLRSTMEETADSLNMQMARQFQLIMDSALGEVDSLYRTLYTDPQVEAYVYKSEVLTDKDYYDGFELINRLSALAQTRSIVSDFFIYFPNSDAVITPGYKLKSSLHYNRISSIPGVEYEAWMEGLLVDGKNFRVMQSSPEGSMGRETIFLIRRLYLTSSDSLNPVLCCAVSPRDIDAKLGFLGDDSSFAVIVRDYTGEIMLQSGLAPSIASPFQIRSGYLGAQYELYLGDHGASGAGGASGFTFIFTIIAFSISILLAFLIAYRNYSPIRLIARRLEPKGQNEGVSNELKHLASSVDQALQNKWAMESELQKMKPVYINHVLMDLLKGASSTCGSSELFEKTGINFSDGLLYVAQALVWGSGKYDYRRKDQGLVQAMISTIAANVFCGEAVVQPVYGGENVLFLIISLNAECSSQRLEALLHGVCNTFSKDIGGSLCLACSAAANSLEGIATACAQAQSAAALADFSEQGTVVFYHKDRKSRLGDIYFPIDEEMKLLNAVRSGNDAQAALLICEIIDENLLERTLDLVSMRFLLLNLSGTLIQCAQQLRYDLSTEVDDFPHLMDDFHSAQEIRDYFVKRFVMLAEFAADRRSGRHRGLVDSIISLVEENYDDSELSVSSLADRISLTPYYLTSIFKEHTGFNISYYIHRVRIQHAKALLEDPSLTLNTIAQMTGYLSDVSFIRTFKRYEGVTPGAYRESLRSFPSS